MVESVCALLADLHAHRVLTMPPETLAANVNQRRELVETADRGAFIRPGDLVEPFVLAASGGGTVSLAEMLRQGPAVLLFFRFADCPACNIAVPYYQRSLYPGLRALGATLIAISPQVPEKLVAIKERHRLEFPVVSDRDNALARRFGIVFTANAESQKALREKGADLGALTGTGTWDLPMPAVIVVGQDFRVRFADISPDWMVRTEAEPVLESVHRARGQATFTEPAPAK